MTDPLVGTTVAHYEVLAKLGGGGMGVVYTARNVRLGQIVALKFLPPQWSHDEGAKQRFLREAQAASATNHRNICTIHDIETASDGQLFIVMAYYQGETLKQKLESGALPVEEAVEIAAQVAEGLAKAHSEGIVHRDIKPGNLMLVDGDVKILDFGLAKFANSLQLTIEGSTLGTVAYMSPEQTRGEEADVRSDVWSLGIVLYEMLAGTLPFKGAYPEAISHAIRNDPQPPIRTSGTSIPAQLMAVLERALQKDPAARYPSARELARSLRELQGRTIPLDLLTAPIPAPPLQLPSRRRWWRSRTAAAAAALLVVGGVVATVWLFTPVDRVPVVVAPVVNQTGYAELDGYRPALTAELIGVLSDSSAIRVLPYGRELQILRRFRTAGQDLSSRAVIQALAASSEARLVIVPTLLYENGAWRAHIQFRDPKTATDVAVGDTTPVVSSLVKNTAYGLLPAAAVAIDEHFLATGPKRAIVASWLRRLTGRTAPPRAVRFSDLDAAAALERALDAFDEQEYAAALEALTAASDHDGSNALLFAWRSRVAQLMRRDREAADAAVQAIRLLPAQTGTAARLFVEAIAAEARRDAPVAESRYMQLQQLFPDDPELLMELAAFRDRRAQLPQAITTYHDALALDGHQARARLELCRLYNRIQEPANAKEQWTQALQENRRLGNRGAEALSLLCAADTLRLGTSAERVEARQDADQALAILQDLGYAYNLPRAYFYVGTVAGQDGRFADASKAMETAVMKAREIGNAVLEPLALMNLGVIYDRLGQPGRAAANYTESSEAYQKLGDDGRAAQIQTNSAYLRIAYGIRPSEAFRDLQNALTVLRKLGDKDFEVYALEGVGVFYRYAGKHDDAERELNRALALAKERDLPDKMASLTVQLGRSKADRGDYSAAVALFQQALGAEAGSNATDARVYLAQTYLRMHNIQAAQDALSAAARDVDKTADERRRPLLDEALGELAYQTGRLTEARSAFGRAVGSSTFEFVDEPVVLASAYLGVLDARAGKPSAGTAALNRVLMLARAAGRTDLQVRCAELQEEMRAPAAHTASR